MSLDAFFSPLFVRVPDTLYYQSHVSSLQQRKISLQQESMGCCHLISFWRCNENLGWLAVLGKIPAAMGRLYLLLFGFKFFNFFLWSWTYTTLNESNIKIPQFSLETNKIIAEQKESKKFIKYPETENFASPQQNTQKKQLENSNNTNKKTKRRNHEQTNRIESKPQRLTLLYLKQHIKYHINLEFLSNI